MEAGGDFLERLRAATSDAAVVTDPDMMAGHLTDWRHMFTGQALAVLRPGSTQEVSRLVRLCAEANVAIVPQGGNTGLAGGATPQGDMPQVVLSLAGMNNIRLVDPVGLCIEVEAGAILQSVRDAAAAEDRLFPVSLAAEGSASIGGIIATNAGGVNVLRYGMTRDLVLGLEVVLADGTVIDALRPLRKDNAARYWKQLFIGSEGVLGIVTAATLRLVSRPLHRSVSLVSVPNVQTALSVFGRAQTVLGDALTAFELMEAAALERVESHFDLTLPVQAGAWYLLIEAGSTLAGLTETVEAMLEDVFEQGWAADGVVASSGAQAEHLWTLREHITEAEAKSGHSVKHDVSLPIVAFPAFLETFRTRLPDVEAEASSNVFGHLGDGNLHVNVLLPEEAGSTGVMRFVHDLVHAHGGSISAEHGLGQYRVAEWERLTSRAEQMLLRRIKMALDPHGILNPGKGLPIKEHKAT
ncbi:putative FAD-linked oxidoreductase [Roseovarius sp. A-2]|uniref:FAD-binding oxidoreductase n=1 Tax=Roseovarius sp. A-2 TaxID=1570360 RepID=UPI0009B58188|nr:FAD-binding oxidoreductase [Roseovarius sp. A-2]GAW33535.1 putative FAD-linked oxidoreductase [Roseovarius sp. A-2]